MNTSKAITDTITRLTAERDEARRERDELLDIPVVLDTPNEVCDGHVALTIREAVKVYGPKCLDWVAAQSLIDELYDANQRNDRLWRERDAARAECEAWREWRGITKITITQENVGYWDDVCAAAGAHDAACPGWRTKEQGK